MELRLHGEVCFVRDTPRVLAEANEESEDIEFRTHESEMFEFLYAISNARRSEYAFENGEECLSARLSERVAFGFRKLQDQVMPEAIRDVQRMDDRNIGQLVLPLGPQSVGGGAWSNRFA